ncbi:MAG: DUF115 domain-containing protein [Candidatus Auribacter fodinae]|jgi:hypothetical protein|uniref:DUF115 domain-containing protein n=1 Tax=Candidatus Auribacter fodinae TaxID=2093366 RepID=A0A3A4RAM3_9BACT|nr:MAG: DUF115 domain-containing protein [Candidatus Auribacter fodinae]
MVDTLQQSVQYRLKRNIELIKQNQPDIAADVAALCNNNGNNGHISVVESRTGVPTLKHGDAMLHSMYDPVKEATRFIDSLTMTPHVNIAVLGLGLGYHVKELVSRSKSRDFILVIEKDPAVFKAFLSHADLREFYGVTKIYFAVDRSPMDIFRALQGCAITLFANGITVVSHQASGKIDPAYYNTIGEKIRDTFQWARVNTVSQIKASEDFATNIFRNMPAYVSTPGINKLFNKFVGFPGIVVSAGPSLNKNIRYLKQAQGKAVIISVDTALRVLLKHGIEPDIVVSIDYTKHNARYFQGIPELNTALIVDPEVYPDITYGYKGPKFMMSLPGKSLCDWLSDAVENKGNMDKGLSVAHTALMLALKLGLTPVGLVGQDLSFPDKMTHVRGSAMVRKSSVSQDQKDTVLVQDIFGGRVITTTSMHVFLKHFEDLLDKHKPDCYDLTEGGAYIAGAKPLSLKEFILRKASQQIDTKNTIHTAYNAKPECNRNLLVQKINAAVKGLKDVVSICSDGVEILNSIEKYVKNNNMSNQRLYQFFKDWASISRKLHSRKDVFRLLGNNITDIMVLQAKKDLGSIDTIDKDNLDGLKDLVNKDKTIFQRLIEQCSMFIKNFDEFKNNVGSDS